MIRMLRNICVVPHATLSSERLTVDRYKENEYDFPQLILSFQFLRIKKKKFFFTLDFSNVGFQNESPEDVLLRHADFFELKETEILGAQEKLLPLLLTT